MDLASKGAFFAQKLKFIRKSAFFYGNPQLDRVD